MGLILSFRAVLKLIHPEYPLHFIFFLSLVDADKEMDKELTEIHVNLKQAKNSYDRFLREKALLCHIGVRSLAVIMHFIKLCCLSLNKYWNDRSGLHRTNDMSRYKQENVGFAFQIQTQWRRQLVGGHLRVNNRSPLVIIGEITLRPHTRNPENCLLSKEQNLFRKKRVF